MKKKNISLLMIFFTVSFSRFAPSRSNPLRFNTQLAVRSSEILGIGLQRASAQFRRCQAHSEESSAGSGACSVVGAKWGRDQQRTITSWRPFFVFCGVSVGNENSARCFSDRSFFEPPWGHGRPRLRVMDVRTEMLNCFSRISRA